VSALDGEVENLENALVRARRQWEATCSLWRDDVQRQFSEIHWSPLESAARDVIDSLARLSIVVEEIERRME
jgi:hypothetical protein